MYKIQFIPNIETWVNINGYNNYQVSQFGRVRNSETGKILKPVLRNKYNIVVLCENNNPKQYVIHRLVADAFLHNHQNKKFVDHIDNNRLNNHIDNLRWCSSKENNRNASKRKNQTSIYKGVCFHKKSKKWRSSIKCDGVSYHLGYYDNEHEAAMAYNVEAENLFGEFAKLNIIE
jgi:hypothetical protein